MTGAHLHTLLGVDGSGDLKKYRSGTHRSRTPQQTLDWIAPKLSAMGITRVASITGLDRIGIPVTMVVRPNSRSLAVSQGKGLSLVNARVSGIMESVETYHAERIEQPLRLADAHALKRLTRIVNTDRIAKSAEREFTEAARLLWIEGVDLLSGEPTCLPYEAVHSDFTTPRQAGSGYFPANTNGLAAGNCLAEAAAHGLYEVIERDAVALWYTRAAFGDNIVNLEDIKDRDCADVLEALSSANMRVRVWNVTSDIGIPCFHCLIMGMEDQFADAEFGSGCHPDSHVALLRALTEAVQSRTTFIAGSRDDFGFETYTDASREKRLNACSDLMMPAGNTVNFESIGGESFDTVSDDLQWVLKHLVQVGVDEVICVNLTLSEFGIPVARVVVPGLEGAYDSTSGDYVPGQRARALLHP